MTPKTNIKKSLTIDSVALLLKKRNLISEEQYTAILSKGNAQKLRLQKYQETAYSRKLLYSSHALLPAEIISSFNIEIPGANGKILTEDIITGAIADEIGMEYRKIDPLKLDIDIVTKHIPRPFAMKHLIVPIEEKNTIVTIAVADPFNLEPLESLKTTKK